MPQTIPFGPATVPADALQRHRRPVCTYALAIGAADTDLATVFNAGLCSRIYCNAAGTVAVQRQGDAELTPYTVVAGTVLEGVFVKVGGTGSGSSAITVNLEL